MPGWIRRLQYACASSRLTRQCFPRFPSGRKLSCRFAQAHRTSRQRFPPAGNTCGIFHTTEDRRFVVLVHGYHAEHMRHERRTHKGSIVIERIDNFDALWYLYTHFCITCGPVNEQVIHSKNPLSLGVVILSRSVLLRIRHPSAAHPMFLCPSPILSHLVHTAQLPLQYLSP